MIKAIHELTGSFSQGIIIFLAVAGLMIFQFKLARPYLQKIKIDRKRLVNLHRIAAALLIPFFAVHYYTTDKSNVYVIAGAIVSLMLIPAGLMFRIKSVKSGHFKAASMVKITVFAVAMILVFIGHNSFDNNHGTEIRTVMAK